MLNPEIPFPDHPFVDEPDGEIAIGDDIIDEVDVIRKGDEPFHDDQHEVDGEEDVPELLTVAEGNGVFTPFDLYLLFGKKERDHALDFQHVFPFGDAFHLNILPLHDAEQLSVEINLVGEGHPHLGGLIDEGQSPMRFENRAIDVAFRGFLTLV